MKSPPGLIAAPLGANATHSRNSTNISQYDTIAYGRAAATAPPGSRLRKADYEALAAFRARLRRFLHFSDEGARAAGLTGQQHQLLLAIKGTPERDWCTVAELAEALQVKHHAAVGLVDRCAQARLVGRTRGARDRREVQVRLTRRGERVLARLSSRNRRELAALRAALALPFLDEIGEARPARRRAT